VRMVLPLNDKAAPAPRGKDASDNSGAGQTENTGSRL